MCKIVFATSSEVSFNYLLQKEGNPMMQIRRNEEELSSNKFERGIVRY